MSTQTQTRRPAPAKEETREAAPRKQTAREKAEPVLAQSADVLDAIDEVLAEDAAAREAASEHAYTLADAIREGAQLAPQAFNTFKSDCGGTCALMAAYEGLQHRGLL